VTTPIPAEPPAPTDDPRVLGALYGAVAFVILLAMVGLARRDVWPLITYHPTSATVDSSLVAGGPSRARDRYIPHVYYTYSVDGHVYRGTRVTPMDIRGKRPWAERLMALYPRGARVTAFYDPEHPEKAFLRHSAPEFWGLLAIFGGWVVFSVWLVVRAIRKRRRTRA